MAKSSGLSNGLVARGVVSGGDVVHGAFVVAVRGLAAVVRLFEY